MAFAGNPTGLAQQAGTSHPWKALLAAIAVLAIGLAMVIAVLFINSRAVAPAVDNSYNQVEAQRGTFGAAAVDRSQDQIEAQRGAAAVDAAAVEKAAAAKARAMSGVPAAIYNWDERPRGTAATGSPLVENARGAGLRTGSALNATTLDRIYEEIQSSRGLHGPLP